jgi:hypothetical protein
MKTIILHETYIGTQFPCALEYGDQHRTSSTTKNANSRTGFPASSMSPKTVTPSTTPSFTSSMAKQSEFETCDITELKGNCVAVTAFILV